MPPTVAEEPGGPSAAATASEARLAEMGGGGLRERAARGTLVNAVWLAGLNALSIGKGVVVAAVLGAAEYGLWGLITVTFGTLFGLAAVGLDDKYIQQDHPDQRAAFQIAFTLQAMLCLLFGVIAVVAIPLFAALYDQPDIVVPGLTLALVMPLIALQTPIWVFYRRMEFLRQRVLQSFEPVVSFAVTMALVLNGVGLWSLVIGTLAGSVTAAVVALCNAPYDLRFRYSPGALREYATFSWPLLFGAATGILLVQIPVAVAARSLGSAAVGAIVLASVISQYTRRVDEIVTTALYPAICAVKDRADLLFETFSKSNRLALLWGFPVGIAVALFAEDVVHLVFGPEWTLAIPLIQIFGVTAAVDQIGFNWTAFARARGETRPIAVASAAGAIVMLGAGIPLLLSHGLPGFAVAVGAGTLSAMVVRFAYLIRLFPALSILGHSTRAMLPTAAAAGLLLAERGLGGADRGLGRVVAEAAVYALIVACGSLLVERPLLTEAFGYLRRAARRDRADVVPASS